MTNRLRVGMSTKQHYVASVITLLLTVFNHLCGLQMTISSFLFAASSNTLSSSVKRGK